MLADVAAVSVSLPILLRHWLTPLPCRRRDDYVTCAALRRDAAITPQYIPKPRQCDTRLTRFCRCRRYAAACSRRQLQHSPRLSMGMLPRHASRLRVVIISLRATRHYVYAATPSSVTISYAAA